MAISNTQKAQVILGALHQMGVDFTPARSLAVNNLILRLYANGKSDGVVASRVINSPVVKKEILKLVKGVHLGDANNDGRVTIAEKRLLYAQLANNLVTEVQKYAPTTLTQDKTVIEEGDGAITYTVTGTPGATINWSVDAGHVADVNNAAGTVTLNALGVGVFTIAATADQLNEGNEQFNVTLTTPGGVVIGGSVATIQDVVIPPASLTPNQTSITEGQGAVTFAVKGTPGETYTWSVDAAHAGDVNAASGSVTLDASGNGSFVVAAKPDLLAETSEQIIVTLTNSTGTVVVSSNLVSIVDNPLVPSDFITLKEVVVPATNGTPPVKAIYWGYNPHDHYESPDDVDNTYGGNTNNQTNEGPQDGGIPVGELVKFLTTITGLDLLELGLIDADGQDPFQNVTNLTLSNPISPSGDQNANTDPGSSIDQTSVLRIEYADGTFLNAEVALGDEYFSFLNNLLFDNEGNSRLFEVEVVPGTSGVEEHFAPIVLTPTQNNGGTVEVNVSTSVEDDLIVAGRLELLHQAYIDAGEGYNTLEVDAKGTYAQPLALRNIQEIRVNDLPNFYTSEYHDADGILENTEYNGPTYAFPSPDGAGSDSSWFDISRATEIEKLVVTDSGYGATGSDGLSEDDGYSGNLSIVGVRNGATLRLEGAFISGTTTIQYGQGQTGALNVELALGDVMQDINILQNASVVNIDSQGIENHMHKFFAGGSVSRMIVTGEAAFAVDEDLAASFNGGRPAIIDASANTGGLDVTLNGHYKVTVNGTQADDEIISNGSTKEQYDSSNGWLSESFPYTNPDIFDVDDVLISQGIATINAGNGNNDIQADYRTIATITSGTGNDNISAMAGDDVTIVAGDGKNVISTNGSANVSITTGTGNDVISARNGSSVTIVAGDGNNNINADYVYSSSFGAFGAAVVDITTGVGNDIISAVRVDSATIDAGGGTNNIRVSANEINVTTGEGNDTLTLSGLDTTFDNGDDEGFGGAGGFNGGNDDNYVYDGHFNDNYAPGALVNLSLGAGNNTINLGRDVTDIDSNPDVDAQFGLTALEGSVITGTGIKLFVENNSDLTQADLTGAAITSVVLKQELRITAEQFTQIGSAAFSVKFDEEGATEDLYIVVTENATLSNLVNLAQMNTSVRLHFEIHNGATLTLSAAELHKYVAEEGIISDDGLNGKVVITDAGLLFNAFDNGDDFQVIDGGTLSSNFFDSEDVTIIRNVNGFNRPEPEDNTDTTLIDSTGLETLVINETVLVDGGNPTTVKIIGNQDVQFNAPIDLGDGGLRGDSIDFSELDGQVLNLTVKNFDNIFSVSGNNTGTRINVEMTGNVADSNQGLISSGVETYVVTSIVDNDDDDGDGNSDTATFWLCDDTRDVEVIGLKGNAGKTLTFQEVPWGLVHPSILLEGDGYANWNGGLKADGNPNASDIGNIVVNYFAPGAPAIVNINNGGVELGVTTTGGERFFDVGSITLGNAVSLSLNITEGDAVIADINSDGTLETVTITATEDVSVTESLPSSLTTINASGIAGVFDASFAPESDFSFIGAVNGSTLTLEGDFEATIDTSIDGGAAGMTLVIADGASINLADAALANIDTVTLGGGATLDLSISQMIEIGAADFVLDIGATSATLNLDGLDGEPFALADFAEGINVSVLSIADLPVVTLNPATDLTGIDGLEVHEGTVLNLTAEQFQQLTGDGDISGVGGTTNFTVNITDLTQASVEGGFDLTGITADNLTVTLAENVALDEDDSLFGATYLTGDTVATSVNIGDNLKLTLGDIADADGLNIIGGVNSTLEFTDAVHSTFEPIDASGFNVTYVRVLNVLVDNANIDLIFTGLPESVTKVIYNDLGFVEGVTQTVILEEGTTVPGFTVFNIPTPETGSEIQNFILNMQGGTEVNGDLELSATVGDENLIRTWLKTVTINSTGTAENLVSGSTANVIAGDLTSQGLFPDSIDNNLLDVTINATQEFTIEGSHAEGGIIFESVTGANNANDDGITANDDEEAVASLTVNGSADVYIGGVNTDDEDVDGLDVVNNGTGVLTVKINGDAIDQTINGDDNDDALSFTGTGDIHLVIDPIVDLSDDDLSAVTQITIEDDGTLYLTQAQIGAIGIGNLLDDGDLTPAGAVLHIKEFGSDAFDATQLDPGIDLQTITIQDGDVTLNPLTNLTDVDQIIVPKGGTLTMTVAQFQQLAGTGTITGIDEDGNPTSDYSVVLTGLTQGDVFNDLNGDLDSDDADESLSLADISSENITMTLATDVNLAEDTDLGNLDNLTIVLADGQTLGLASDVQANGLNVDGGDNTTIIYQFVALQPFPGQIDASGYDVTVLKALAQSFQDIEGTSNVEYTIDDLPSTVELRLYDDPSDLGFLNSTFRRVVIEADIATPSGLIFNDWDSTDEVRTLDLTLEGGVTVRGDLSIPTRTDKDGAFGVQQFFDRLTINSQGASENTIEGNINTAEDLDGADPENTSENNLLNIDITAEQDLVIDGNIEFNSIDVPDDDALALLTIVDGTADVTIDQLIASDEDIASLMVTNESSGLLTVTGSSPAIDGGDTLETLLLTGQGDIVLGDLNLVSDNTGVSGLVLSTIDASGLSGNLNLGEIEQVDYADFSLIAGTGTTIAMLTDDALDSTGEDFIPGNADDTAGWNIDYSNADVGSEFHLSGGLDGVMDFVVPGSKLNIDMGPNGVLYIDGTMDLSELDLDILQSQPIVLADGVTLTLSAAQANGLTIIAGDDTGTAGFTGKVHIVGLDGSPVDFSGIQAAVAGNVSLTEDQDDVTLNVSTNLGAFTVLLDDLGGDDSSLSGQTIRFNTVAQAAREIKVINDLGTQNDSSTNVVWLFKSIVAPVDTSKYDSALGRLWLNEDLITSQSGNIENLFTTLPDPILRVDFADITALNAQLSSRPVDRTIEFVHFTNLGNLTESDVGGSPDEFIRTLDMRLGGQVVLGNLAIDDVIGGANIDQNSIHFDGLTINSYRAVKTGDLLVAHGTSSATDYFNDNDAATEQRVDSAGAPTGPSSDIEYIPPQNINTIGAIHANDSNAHVDLTKVSLNTWGVTTLGDGSAGKGAALETGTITFDTALAGGATGNLNVKGDNNVTIASVDHSDSGFTSFNLNTGGFTATLSAPGASPAINLGTAAGVQNTEIFNITGAPGANNGTLRITTDMVDDNDEHMHISYKIDGVDAPTPLDVNLSGVDVTSASAVAVAVAAALDALPGISAGSVGGVVTVTPDAGHSYQTTGVTTSGTQDKLDAAVQNGEVINFGSAANAGVVGDDLSSINASGYYGTLNLGTVALIDGTDDVATDFNGDGDKVDAGESANMAFSFASGHGINTMTLGSKNGFTPHLVAGNNWSFDYSNKAPGSSLTITDEVIFDPTVDPLDPTTLHLIDAPLIIKGNVDFTKITLDFNAGTTISVPAGNTLKLTIGQVQQLEGAGVVISGSGTTLIVGDGTDNDLLSLVALKTVGVDISGVTLDTTLPQPKDADGQFHLIVDGAKDDNGVNVGQSVIGSPNDDVITTSTHYADTIKGGAGNDTLLGQGVDGPSIGGDTYIVDQGTDTIPRLLGGLADPTVADNLQVSAGATANAHVDSFWDWKATDDSFNNGTANVTREPSVVWGTIDVSLAGGSNGFNLSGSADPVNYSDRLIGSANNDVINGGNLHQTGGVIDRLTGNGGSDIFQFDVDLGNTALLSVVTTQANVDKETFIVTAGDPDDNNETIRVDYLINFAPFSVDVDLSGVDVTSQSAIAAAIAGALQTNGAFISNATSNASGEVTATASSGYNLEFTGGVATGGTITTMGIDFSPANQDDLDVAQKTTLTVTGAPTPGDQYSLLVDPNTIAPNFPSAYTATGGDTAVNVASGLQTGFPLNLFVDAVQEVAPNDNVVTFTNLLPDEGGFNLTTDTTAGFGGSGASATSLDYHTADIITDFLSGTDKVEFHTEASTDMQPGSGGNYLEAPEVANYAAALANATTAFTNNAGTLQYYLTSVTDMDGSVGTNLIEGQEGGGVLFFDANLDGQADGVILMTGVAQGNFSAFDIIAS